MKPTLKACPFCGSDDVGVLAGINSLTVRCRNCQAEGPPKATLYTMMEDDDQIEAAERQWNEREARDASQ